MANLTFSFFGAKVWNSIEESFKSKNRTCFKIPLKEVHFPVFACALPLVYCYLCARVRVCA